MILRVKRPRPDVELPAYATPGAAAMDLRAAEDVTLAPGQRAMVPTGLAIELPGPDYVALMFPRSSLGLKYGLAFTNGVGVIDSDYRGELSVHLVNQGDAPCTLHKGERIAQLAVVPLVQARVEEAQSLSETGRGTGGWGSTGRF